MKILFFGDIFGRPGREVLKLAMPEWREKYKPDIIMANGENMSHGAGISETALKEIMETGVDIITGGNHSLEGKNAAEILNNPGLPVLRPANMPDGLPGLGYAFFGIENREPRPFEKERGKLRIMDSAEGADLMVINLIGQVNMRYHYNSPFEAVDKILSLVGEVNLPIIVDWHADASSEKMAMGWYLDGRVSAVIGTHSHIPTADERILPKGAAYISDAGMVGPYHSIIGQEITLNLERFIKQIPKKVEVAAAPAFEVNAVYLEIDEKTSRTIEIRRLRKIVD